MTAANVRSSYQWYKAAPARRARKQSMDVCILTNHVMFEGRTAMSSIGSAY